MYFVLLRGLVLDLHASRSQVLEAGRFLDSYLGIARGLHSVFNCLVALASPSPCFSVHAAPTLPDLYSIWLLPRCAGELEFPHHGSTNPSFHVLPLCACKFGTGLAPKPVKNKNKLVG